MKKRFQNRGVDVVVRLDGLPHAALLEVNFGNTNQKGTAVVQPAYTKGLE